MTKILLVEDDKALREIYGVRLLAEGYDIVSAGDGEEALSVAIRERPALIISDVMMPKISGFEMLDLLRNNEATKNIKVIMMTALSGDQHRERGQSLGADRYLVKSQVGIEDVVNTVHEILGDRNAAVAPQNNAAAPTPAPAMPALNQSPVNPPQAVSPNAVAGVPAPALPPTPPSVPVVTAPLAPAPMQAPTAPVVSMPAAPAAPAPTAPPPAPPAPVAPAPAPVAPAAPPHPVPPTIAAVPDVPPMPQAPANTPNLPPVAPPAPNVKNVPSFQPTYPSEEDEDQAVGSDPAVNQAQATPHTAGIRVIQPTGESVTPKIDMENLLANEEAKDIMAQPITAPDPEPIPEPQPAPNVPPVPEIQIDSSGVISVDSLPSAPTSFVDTTGTFPQQQS